MNSPTVKQSIGSNKQRTTAEFVQQARMLHGDRYDYSQVNYRNANTKVVILCSEHGVFEQQPASHLRGMGCRRCAEQTRGKDRRLTLDGFTEKAKRKHQGKYLYQNVKYVGTDQLITITCPEHGDFQQTPHSHLAGGGCPKCRSTRISNLRTITRERFLELAAAKHSAKYKYDLTDYVNAQSVILITCPTHGAFQQTARQHYSGQGCPTCGSQRSADSIRSDTQKFIQAALLVHGDHYDYSQVQYEKSNKKVIIVCPQHGVFRQQPNSHLGGHGCPSCGVLISKGEIKLFSEIKKLFPDAITQDRSGIAGYGDKYPLELDIYIPSANLAVEVNGLRWHSSALQDKKGRDWVLNHQLRKTQNCEKNGVHLLTFYEDEVMDRFDIVMSTVTTKALHNQNAIAARKSTVRTVSWSEARNFLETYHIQGPCPSAPAKGLFYKDELVALMTFSKARSIRGSTESGVYELTRYASSKRVIGGCSKLLKAFLRETPGVTTVVSYADKRLSTGGMYRSMGFTLKHETPPDYVYVYKNQRRHKSGFRRSRLPEVLPDFDPSLTEEANCRNHKIYKLYNCGLQRWELSIP